MPQPLRLSDSELDAVMAAARPLDRDQRDAFLQAVAHALSDRNVIGPGVVHRICAELQRQFMPVLPEVERVPPRWSRRDAGRKFA